jgi:succinyl-CoA synthetase beta subunit
MHKDIAEYTEGCLNCKLFKGTIQTRSGKLHLFSQGSYRFEVVHVEILSPFPRTAKGNIYVSVVIDQYSRWVELNAMGDMTAETVAEHFVDGVITRHGA